MEKKNYYTPEVKFHQLRGNAVMQVTSPGGEGDPEESGNGGENRPDLESKGFGSFYFDEDE